ncbi:MAG: hypothetical protein SX243_15170 [Acidobacteriota bacterium]|nr:hypothetical protein [Acidobacteriota bacterium]
MKIGDGQPISLPRGYSILSVNGERISPPHLANEPTSYDGDLRSIQALFELKKAGRAKIEVLRDGHPPTAWLAGAALFYYPAWPSHLPQACANRFDELSALKVIELRFEHNQLLRILASEFSEHRVNNPAAR